MESKHEILKMALKEVKMIDAGVKQKERYGMNMPKSSASEDEGDKISYPTLYITAKEAPVLVGKEVGDSCVLLVKAKVIGHNLSESNDYSSEDYRLEIRSIGAVKKGGEEY